MTTPILLTTDSFTPTNISLWNKYWDKLKDEHRKLKVTVFTIPFFNSRANEDICDNKSFEDWFNSRRSWVKIAQHGYTYSKPPECKRFKNTQYSLIKRGMRKIGGYIDDDFYIFKAPYYQMNEFTVEVLQSLGFSCCVYFGKLIILKKINQTIPNFQIIETHTNFDETNPDDIRFIYNKLDNYLFELERKDTIFVTLNEIITPHLAKDYLQSPTEKINN